MMMTLELGSRNARGVLLTLMVMVAMVFTPTLHHAAAEARPVACHDHLETSLSDGKETNCQHRRHAAAGCCSTGLCFAAILAGSVVYAQAPRQDQLLTVQQPTVRTASSRIERPPKVS